MSPAELFLGDVKPGGEVTKKLVVRGKKAFRVTSIGCKDDCFSFKESKESKKLHIIPVTFTAPEKTGDIKQMILIETDLGGAKKSIKAHVRVAAS